MNRKYLFAALIASAATASLPTIAAAEEKTLIIMDGSGSMWGQIDGVPKLQIARDTLQSVLPEISPDTQIGLMAYGHRRKGDCGDIELLVEPATGTQSAITTAAQSMRFLGKTPLSQAVRQGAKAMRYTEDKATLILITDGIETCDADPCALANELEQQGIDFTAHVVGFGLSRDEGRQIACIAENTGGRYIQAGDQAALRDALTQTIVAAEEKPEEITDTLPAATVEAVGTPYIGQDFEVAWTGPGAPADYVDLVPQGYTETRGELSYQYLNAPSPATLRAPREPGTYAVRYVWQGQKQRYVAATAMIEVLDSEAILDAPSSVVAGAMFDVFWKGPDNSGDYVDFVPRGYQETSGEVTYFYTNAANPSRMRAPSAAGRYDIRYIVQGADGRKVLLTNAIEVTEATAALSFAPSAVAGTEVTVAFDGLVGPNHYIDIVPSGYTETSGEITYAYVDGAQDGEIVSLKMPANAGTYDIRYILSGSDERKVLATKAISVEPAMAALEVTGDIMAGERFEVRWTGPDAERDYIDMVPSGYAKPDSELTYAYTASASDGVSKLTAPDAPGRYDLRYILQGSDERKVIATLPIEVR